VFTNKDYYHVPGLRPDLEALQRNVNLVKELGLIGADTDVKKYFRPEHSGRGNQAPEIDRAAFRIEGPLDATKKHRIWAQGATDQVGHRNYLAQLLPHMKALHRSGLRASSSRP